MILCITAACGRPPAAVSDPGPLEFVGSATCNECHAPQFALWQASHHALAMQPATPETVRGDFSGVEYQYFDITSRFFAADGRFYVRTDGTSGELDDFEVKYTFGVTPLQQYLVELPQGHVQALPYAWDSRDAAAGGQRWFHLYPDEAINQADPLHWTRREQNWNYMCAECHSTNVQKNYDPASDTYDTTWSEINIGCEACHGPASRHVAAARSGESTGGLPADLDDHGRAVWRMNPLTGIAERSALPMQRPKQPEACGRCHARRSLAAAEYEFGRPLHDTHRPALLEENLYYADGQVREEVYVYGSFLQSRMYRAGVTCSDCHDPHSARLKTAGQPSDVCSTCHSPAKFAGSEHHRHRPGNAECVDCHMPARNYMVVDDRRDHSMRIPRPDLTLATGSPNACNLCHGDRDAEWALAAVESWYGTRDDAQYATAIHAGRHAAPRANDDLLAAVQNSDFPGIARATSLSLLQAPFDPVVLAAIRQQLADPDSIVRAAALSALPGAAAEAVLRQAPPLLSDPVRSVRIEAARVLSPLQSSLQGGELLRFHAANRERRAAELAMAERPEAQLNLGNLYADAGDLQGAVAAFRQALRLEPLAAAARVNLADLYAANGRLPDAQQILRDGLATGADEAVLRHALGLILVRNDQPGAALRELAAAAELRPDDARFVYVYAVALNSTGQPDLSIGVLRSAVERFPGNFDVHWALATILRDAGQTAGAREVVARMRDLFPRIVAVRDLAQSL